VFDFGSSALEQQVENLEIVISRDGIVSALVFWFDLILDEDIVVSTSPFVPPEQVIRKRERGIRIYKICI